MVSSLSMLPLLLKHDDDDFWTMRVHATIFKGIKSLPYLSIYPPWKTIFISLTFIKFMLYPNSFSRDDNHYHWSGMYTTTAHQILRLRCLSFLLIHQYSLSSSVMRNAGEWVDLTVTTRYHSTPCVVCTFTGVCSELVE